MVFGAAASFAMADRMAPLTVAPTPRWLRQWLRLMVMAVPAAISWLVLYAIVRGAVGAAAIGPAGDVAVEAVVCGLTGLAGAAVAARDRHLVTASLFLSGTHSPWPVPGALHWTPVHRYWLVSLSVLVVVLVLANRDTWPLWSRP